MNELNAYVTCMVNNIEREGGGGGGGSRHDKMLANIGEIPGKVQTIRISTSVNLNCYWKVLSILTN